VRKTTHDKIVKNIRIYHNVKKFFLLAILVFSSLFSSCGNPLIDQIVEPREITFQSNGGSRVKNQTVFKGQTINKPADPSRYGYTFNAWYSDDETFLEVWDFDVIPTGDTTLYAKWEPNIYTITFDADGGIPAPEEQNVVYNTRGTEPPPMSKKGHVFGGWYREKELLNQWNFANDVIAGDTMLYARWLPNTAGITLNVKQIIDDAPIIANITISLAGKNGLLDAYTVSVDASDYDPGSIRWKVAGVGFYAGQYVTGSGASFTLETSEIKYNSLGGHVLILTVAKGGIDYQSAIPFTIVE